VEGLSRGIGNEKTAAGNRKVSKLFGARFRLYRNNYYKPIILSKSSREIPGKIAYRFSSNKEFPGLTLPGLTVKAIR
jgi:hypothetical protein